MMESLLGELDHNDFWTKTLFVQAVRMLDIMDQHGAKQVDIAKCLGVSEALISRYKKYHRYHPEENRPRPGPKNVLDGVFGQIQHFVDRKNHEKKSVTIGVLLCFVVDKLGVVVSRKTLRNYMKMHAFAYSPAMPTDSRRITVKKEDIERFYANLANDLEGVHPALVFNVDEMGVEMFADRKEVKVFVRPEQIPADGPLYVGVPRSSRRCMVVACIALNGSTLIPTIITRTITLNSHVFDRGYSFRNVRVFSTETSFITGNIFHRWVCEVFIPRVNQTRSFLRTALGPFNDKAVLIMDGCSAHKVEELQPIFEANRIVVRFLVPHSSHLTQPLDLGIFGRCKSILRSDSHYVIQLRDLDDVIVDDIEANRENRPPSPEKGKLLADFILQILKAYHQATPPDNVVSAFEQAGICSRATGIDPYMVGREAFLDPTRARLVMRSLGLFTDHVPVRDLPRRQLKIDELNCTLRTVLIERGLVIPSTTNGESLEENAPTNDRRSVSGQRRSTRSRRNVRNAGRGEREATEHQISSVNSISTRPTHSSETIPSSFPSLPLTRTTPSTIVSIRSLSSTRTPSRHSRRRARPSLHSRRRAQPSRHSLRPRRRARPSRHSRQRARPRRPSRHSLLPTRLPPPCCLLSFLPTASRHALALVFVFVFLVPGLRRLSQPDSLLLEPPPTRNE